MLLFSARRSSWAAAGRGGAGVVGGGAAWGGLGREGRRRRREEGTSGRSRPATAARAPGGGRAPRHQARGRRRPRRLPRRPPPRDLPDRSILRPRWFLVNTGNSEMKQTCWRASAGRGDAPPPSARAAPACPLPPDVAPAWEAPDPAARGEPFPRPSQEITWTRAPKGGCGAAPPRRVRL